MDKRLFERLMRRAIHEQAQAQTGPIVLEAKIVGGTYEGPDATLLGKHALVQTIKDDKGHILVQFDDVGTGQGYGWHKHDVEDWCLEVEVI